MPKILFSDNSLWGLLNFRGYIIQYFLSKGYDVVLVAPMDQEGSQMTIPCGVKYVPITMCRAGTNPIEDIQYYFRIRKIYKQERPDYIFHYTIKPNIYGTIAAKSLRIPTTVMIAGLGYAFTENTISSYIARLMYKFALRYTQYAFVLNKSNYDVLIRENIISPSKLIWLKGGEGVDLDKFAYADMPKNSKPRFLMMSRLLYDKGYTEFVCAAASLKSKATFVVMGAIDPRPTAVPLDVIQADSASNIIEYIAFTPDVQMQIKQSDCIVLPSYYGEGLSRVLMEACAMGRPIICSNISGCKETVDDSINGFLCQPRDVDSLINCCQKFMSLSPEQREQMGYASRQKAEKEFDEKIVIRQYDHLIASLLQHANEDTVHMQE